MSFTLRIALPAALALSAFAVQAHTLEIDYPATGGSFAAAPSLVIEYAGTPVAPFLLQSNYEGPQVHPDYLSNAQPRIEAPARPMIAEPWGPGHNA